MMVASRHQDNLLVEYPGCYQYHQTLKFLRFFLGVEKLIISSLLCAYFNLPSFRYLVVFEASASLTYSWSNFFLVLFKIYTRTESTRSGRVSPLRNCDLEWSFVGKNSFRYKSTKWVQLWGWFSNWLSCEDGPLN